MASYPLSPMAARGRMSGPASSRIGHCGLSLASPPVSSNASGRSWKSVFRWILVEKPPLERPSAWPDCPMACASRRDVGAHYRAIELLHQVCGWTVLGQHLEESLEHAGVAQPPEPLPHAVPLAEPLRQRTPRDVVSREIMERLKKEPVVASLVASPGPRRPKRFQRNAPVRLAHPGQHGRPPNRPPMNQPNSGSATPSAMPESIRPHRLEPPESRLAAAVVSEGQLYAEGGFNLSSTAGDIWNWKPKPIKSHQNKSRFKPIALQVIVFDGADRGTRTPDLLITKRY